MPETPTLPKPMSKPDVCRRAIKFYRLWTSDRICKLLIPAGAIIRGAFVDYATPKIIAEVDTTQPEVEHIFYQLEVENAIPTVSGFTLDYIGQWIHPNSHVNRLVYLANPIVEQPEKQVKESSDGA